jgi:hypothetical protein
VEQDEESSTFFGFVQPCSLPGKSEPQTQNATNLSNTTKQNEEIQKLDFN